MTDAEFQAEVRRHLIAIIRAFIIHYHLTWRDFMPADERHTVDVTG